MFSKLASMFVEVENAPTPIPSQEKKPVQPVPSGYAAAASALH
jgi:hypothetical protein